MLVPPSSGRANSSPLMNWLDTLPASSVFARGQGTFHGQPAAPCSNRRPCSPIQRFVDGLGPLHQPSAAGKSHFLPGQAGQRDEEAQGAAALAAVHGGIKRQKVAQPLHHRIVCTGGAHGRTAAAGCAQRGGDILAESKMMEMGASPLPAPRRAPPGEPCFCWAAL